MFSNNKLATAVIGVLVVLAYPYETTVVPEQRALFVTNDMHPIKDALIRQSWQHYSLESEGHEEDLPTDSHGRVTFPKRTIRAPLIWRALGPLADIAGQGCTPASAFTLTCFRSLTPAASSFRQKSRNLNQGTMCFAKAAPNRIVRREQRERVS